MIRDSLFLMACFDVVVLSIVLFSFWKIYPLKTLLPSSSPVKGTYSILTGLGLIGLFCAADMLIMASLLIQEKKVMLMAMRNLHLNYGWYINLVGILTIAYGLSQFSDKSISLLSELHQANQDMNKERK